MNRTFNFTSHSNIKRKVMTIHIWCVTDHHITIPVCEIFLPKELIEVLCWPYCTSSYRKIGGKCLHFNPLSQKASLLKFLCNNWVFLLSDNTFGCILHEIQNIFTQLNITVFITRLLEKSFNLLSNFSVFTFKLTYLTLRLKLKCGLELMILGSNLVTPAGFLELKLLHD